MTIDECRCWLARYRQQRQHEERVRQELRELQQGRDTDASLLISTGREQLLAEIARSEAIRDEIRQSICRIGDQELQDLLIQRYIIGLTAREMAALWHYSPRQIRRLLRTAALRLKDVLDCPHVKE